MVDGISWGFGVMAAVVVGVVVFRSVQHLFADGPGLSPASIAALSGAGVTMSGEPAGGWSTGVSERGVAVLAREIVGEDGEVATWKSVRKLVVSWLALKPSLSEQGLSPTALVIVRGRAGLHTRVDGVVVCSTDRIHHTLRTASPSIANIREIARGEGIQLGRASARKVDRATAGKSTTRVVNQGRVTRRVRDDD
jgi:hypothetical protein